MHLSNDIAIFYDSYNKNAVDQFSSLTKQLGLDPSTFEESAISIALSQKEREEVTKLIEEDPNKYKEDDYTSSRRCSRNTNWPFNSNYFFRTVINKVENTP